MLLVVTDGNELFMRHRWRAKCMLLAAVTDGNELTHDSSKSARPHAFTSELSSLCDGDVALAPMSSAGAHEVIFMHYLHYNDS